MSEGVASSEARRAHVGGSRWRKWSFFFLPSWSFQNNHAPQTLSTGPSHVTSHFQSSRQFLIQRPTAAAVGHREIMNTLVVIRRTLFRLIINTCHHGNFAIMPGCQRLRGGRDFESSLFDVCTAHIQDCICSLRHLWMYRTLYQCVILFVNAND